MELQKFWKTVPDKESLDELTRPQAQGIFRLLMLSAFVDGEVTTTERLTLAQAVTRLPFFHPDEWKKFETTEGIQMLANLHERFQDPEALQEMVGQISESLGDEPTRVLALRMVALFMQPDGYDTDEHAFCLMIGQAFGLDSEEVNVVIEDVVDFADSP